MMHRPSKKIPPVLFFGSAMPSGPVALAMALTGTLPALAAPLYYDGTAAGTWSNLADWSTDPAFTIPDPAAVPGALDDVFFNVSSVNGAETIALGGVQSANSLTFNNTGTTSLTGAASGTTPALHIGSGGLTIAANAGPGALNITGAASATLNPIFLSASQTWNNLSANTFTLANNFGSAAGTNLTIANGTFDMTATTNFSAVQGNLRLQNNAKLQFRGDFTINGGLDGTAGTTIENSGAGSKWMFVNNPTGVTNNFGGTIQGNPGTPTVLLGLVKRGLGTQILTGNINQGEYLAVETGKVVLDGGNYSFARNNTAITSGTAANNQGILHLKSGTLKTTLHEMRVGSSGAGSYGAYTQDGGILSTARWMGVGANNDRGVVNLKGGTINVGTTSDFLTIAIGGTAAVGVFNVAGGTLNATAATGGGIVVGERGNGTLNVISGTVNAATRGVAFGDAGANTGWNSTVNLLGGTVNTNRVGKGNATGAAGAGVSTLNFNGGTLAATVANATFLEGLTNAYVYSGGGTVSNGGNSITIAQNLIAPTGNGVSAAGLIITGSGFLDTPLVSITGDGVGAKAVANIDAGGNLTGITITNPGTGYTTATFDLLKTANATVTGGIGATYSITGTPVLTANTAGNLTYSGTGTTRLAGANTYGQSTVSSGTNLQVDGSLAGGVVTNTAATLSGIGSIGGNITSTGSTISPGINGGTGVGALAVSGSISLDSASFLSLTINDDVAGSLDQIVNTGTFTAGSATLTGAFADTSYNAAYSPASLAVATRYRIVTGPVSGMFGNATLIPGADLAALGLPAGSYEVSLSSQRFYVEIGSFNLVPIPEPATTGLLAGLAALGLSRRRRS